MMIKIDFISVIKGYNERNKVLSRIWISIAILSLFIIVNLSELNLKIGIDVKLTIPLINIELSIFAFNLIAIGFLTALIIRWMEVYHRIVSFRQHTIQSILDKSNKVNINGVEILSIDIFDGLVHSSTSTVWGLIGYLLNTPFRKYKILLKILLVFLKIISISVHFALPLFAIYFVMKYLAVFTFTHYETTYLIVLFIVFTIIMVLISLLLLFEGIITEIKMARVALKALTKRMENYEQGL